MSAATLPARPAKVRDPRTGLRTSATLATVFTLLGHTWLGFEQPHAYVVVALLTGYTCALLFEFIDAKANQRPLGFMGGGPVKVVDFLLSAHMTSITLSFLLYVQDSLAVLAFAVALAIGSKFLFRVKIDGRYRHFLNPSNFALVVTLAVFQTSALIPWAYTIDISGAADVLFPLAVVMLGTRLNVLFTKRVPLILAFLVTFALQGLVRSFLYGAPAMGELSSMTGIAFILYTFYMITDPMTSPVRLRSQILFGASISVVYGILMVVHLQFAAFYAVAAVTCARGVGLFVMSMMASRALNTVGEPALQGQAGK